MDKIQAKEITQKQLIRLLQHSKSKSNIHFGFILGAGASIRSGIPSGSSLAQKWYQEIIEDIPNQSLETWIKDKKINVDNLAESYTKIFAKRFETDYKAGYEELQQHMDKAKPSVGYSFFAQFLVETQHKIVITTNFDTMIEDALFGHKKARPMVLGHELLSQYLNTTSPTRPTIIKIHRDFLFDPYNTDGDVQTMDDQWQKSLEPVLKEHSMIIIGYGGNDDSLMNYLQKIENKKPIYWCYIGDKEQLSNNIKNLLTEKDFIIQIKGFDKFMLSLSDKLGFDSIIDSNDIQKSTIVQNALEYAEEYKQQLEELTKEGLDSQEQKAIEKLLPSWWHYELKVQNEQEDKKKEEIYKEGLEAYKKSHELMNNYAILLDKLDRDAEAEHYYKKALEIEPNNADNNGNYAILLQKLDRDDEAEHYYKKALEIEPNNATKNCNYAILLEKLDRVNEAEHYCKKALEIEPNNANNNCHYASLLQKLDRDDEAEHYYKKALEIEPNNGIFNGNYAQLLLIQGKKEDAESYMEKAFENVSNAKDLLIELWFYRLAHYPKYFDEAKVKLDELISQRYKSIGWDFSKNITQAKQEGNVDIELLKQYSSEITTKPPKKI